MQASRRQLRKQPGSWGGPEGNADYRAHEAAVALPTGYRWIDAADFERLAWPNVFSKLLAAHFSGALYENAEKR
ncbi:NUDIX hydrolase [Cohnella rhizosphaerae]|uniref:Uncharacterized protein n=1 Tax=Cohnella rhizosphaerae TaxID=1457232 RepID=A0A9X4KXH3_9BACL|nr:hypothetical protein [Cohnella rhizosphaerae]MDG0810069.1 hypothetical protein [Cohnella rhizosphaerae]